MIIHGYDLYTVAGSSSLNTFLAIPTSAFLAGACLYDSPFETLDEGVPVLDCITFN